MELEMKISKLVADQIANTVRDGFNTLREFYKNNFLLVRDVYKNRVQALDAQGNILSLPATISSTVVEVKFELDVDSIVFYASQDILVDTNPSMTAPMRFVGSTIYSLNLRMKKIFLKRAGTSDASVHIWGMC